jgi:single-strand DNA-binding protein
MANYNRVIMIGNLTRDPDYKQLTSGQAICRFGLASNRQFKNKQTGTMTQEVCFVDIDVWGVQADNCNQFLRKGSSVLVEGRLKFDSWQDAEGNRRTKHAVVAERVTFLSTMQSQSQNDNFNQGNDGFSTNDKDKSASLDSGNYYVKSEKESSGEVELKKDAPFDDELPF